MPCKRHIYLLVLSLFLTSCVTVNNTNNRPTKANPYKMVAYQSSRYTQKHDGAPKGPIPTVFKAVKPKAEPLSRYGNPDRYAVKGRTYHVLKTAKHYKTRGVASWYGTKFHNHRTSSGDLYNMYAMTAAHKTLPLPSYVKVRNLINGRVAIVKVNDRGPFRHDRVIDLSYAAAVKLGILPRGTAPVEIESLNLGPKVSHYYVQAGAFNIEKSALNLKYKLKKLTPSPVVIEKHQRQYVVSVGPFSNRDMSVRLKNILTAHGIPGSFSLLR